MDPHPDKIEIEIDRDSLRRCLVARFSFTWALFMMVIMFFGIAIACSAVSDSGVIRGLQILGWWIVGSSTACIAGYFIFTHRRVMRVVKDTSICVEGSFVRVRTYDLINGQWHDRKLHFKVVVDYDIIEDDWMRRYQIQYLRLNTLSGGMASAIVIPAVKDCEKVRDLLTEIDQARESS